MPTAPIAQWVKEWYTAAESKVSSEDLAQQIKDLEEDMKIKLKLWMNVRNKYSFLFPCLFPDGAFLLRHLEELTFVLLLDVSAAAAFWLDHLGAQVHVPVWYLARPGYQTLKLGRQWISLIESWRQITVDKAILDWYVRIINVKLRCVIVPLNSWNVAA